MTPINDREFERLLGAVRRESLHLETRDGYGTVVELPHMARWAAGEPDDDDWLQAWCGTLREGVEAGRRYRRARIVSEPLSDYQRWSYSIAAPMVAAGEDIRWIPRRLVSSIAIPGNDFYLLDNETVIFLLYSGNGMGTEKLLSANPAHIELCRAAFASLWPLATRHDEYQPV